MRRDEDLLSPDGPGDHAPRLRVSDSEREQVVELLSEHAAEGRLTLEELDGRVDSAHAARTRGELAAVVGDLPVGDRTPSTQGHMGGPSRQLIFFVAVNLVLVAVWALSGAGYFWPIWPILGWGLCLVRPGPFGHRRGARASTRPAEAGLWLGDQR